MIDDLSRRSGAATKADVNAADVEKAKDADIDKAAAGETLPPPKQKCEECEDTRAERIARRGQDPPDPAEI